ncbi:MAG: hypothetical protein JKY96_02015 [Phycisphaerales bacterium]|nr:hypothetical protein [Phycisphaerales bacterium]
MPSIAVILLASTPRKSWLALVIPGTIAGLVVIAPWLLRNVIASGNPVFPHAGSLFGSGHWSGEQLTRFADAHHFDGSITDRISMLLFPDSDAPTGIHVARFRGLTNLQWGLLPGATVLSLVWLLVRKDTRKLGATMLVAIGIPVLAWLFATHLQSRFFVPLAPLAACTVALACMKLPKPKPIAVGLGIAAMIWTTMVFANQRDTNPNDLLTIGTTLYTDPIIFDGQSQTLTWTAAINAQIQNTDTIYLLGDATPAYLRPQVIYSTTYDTPAIAGFIERFPDQPERWIEGLVGLGVDWIVINPSELARLSGSGWIDPRISPLSIGQLTDSLSGSPMIQLDRIRRAYRIIDFVPAITKSTTTPPAP